MKKISLILFFCLLAWGISAQDFASTYIGKYGDKGLEIVSIGKQMLSMVESMTSKDQELKEALQGLESIKIITAESKEQAQKCFKNAYGMLKKKSSGFEEIMSFRENEEETYIMTREEDGIIKDLVFLSSEKGNLNMICLSGNINMSTLAKLASSMKLDKLNNKLDTAEQN